LGVIGKMAKKLFVGGLSWDTTDSTLSEFFSKIGKVVSVNIITDRYSGKSKGFGFVEMETDEDAEKAKQELNGQTLDGRSVAVTDARPQQPRDNNFSPRSFGGGFDKRGNDRRGRDNKRGGRY